MENEIFRMKTDGFHGELFRPQRDEYPGKALICFGGSDGKFELARRLAAERIMERLREKSFPYPHWHLSYDYGGHLFVPVELPAVKFFRGDRGKNKEPGRGPGWTPWKKRWNLSRSGRGG